MTDPVFGELEAEDEVTLCRKWILDFGGKPCEVKLLLDRRYQKTEDIEKQRDTFQHFMEKWPEIQPKLMDELIRYYNEEVRFAWGPDDEEEFAAWWPEIETRDALLKAVTLETILIPADFILDLKGGRYLYLLFARAWGGEDWDDNGVGVGFLNEEIDEVGYKTIAF